MIEAFDALKTIANNSIDGQKPSWKNFLTRNVPGVDYSRSKDGEKLPNEEEYRTWIREKILSQVKASNFNGINPNAADLSEDLIAWTYRGKIQPTATQKVEFIDELLSALPEEPEYWHQQYEHFKFEAEKLKNDAQAEISGEANSEYDDPDYRDSNTTPSDPQ